jgi:hypothetical protein
MQDGPTISNSPEGHNLTVSRVEINMPTPAVTPGSPLVKVLIKYPTDWKKDKFFKNGDVKEVSPEAAATFVEIGIATMYNPGEASAETGNESEENLSEQSVATEVESATEEAAVIDSEESVDKPKGGKKNAGK